MASNKYDFAKTTYAQDLLKRYPDMGASADEVFAKIAALDPTSTAKDEKQRDTYLFWICRNILKENPRQQDLYKIRDDLTVFARFVKIEQNKKNTDKTFEKTLDPNLDAYTLQSLGDAVFPHMSLLEEELSAAERKRRREVADAGTVVLYDSAAGKILRPTTMEASQFWGQGTRWCISATKADNMFETYDNDGKSPILMFLPKGVKGKYAFNEIDGQIRDEKDQAVILSRSAGYFEKKNAEAIVPQLSEFMASALSDEKAKVAFATQDEAVQKSVQLFMIQCPQAYIRVMETMGNENLPDYLKRPEMIKAMARFIEAPTSAKDKNCDQIVKFFLSHSMLKELCSNPELEEEQKIIRHSLNFRFSSKEFQEIYSSYFQKQGVMPETQAECLNVLRARYNAATDIVTSLQGFEIFCSDELVEFVQDYMSRIPKSFWEDEEFSSRVLDIVDYMPATLMPIIPEAFQHPRVWKGIHDDNGIVYFHGYMEDTDDMGGLWAKTLDGKPFLDAILPDRIKHLDEAWRYYDSSKNAEGVDYTGLMKRIEATYPDGFSTLQDVETAVYDMEKCDFSKLLEKTVSRHPEFFREIDLSKQTLAMAISAVSQQPELLSDVSLTFLKAAQKPRELVEAYQALPDGSTDKNALAQYFELKIV